MSVQVFVTGIGTDVGKTVVAAALVHLLKAAYWKPIQTGAEGTTDSSTIKQLTSHCSHIFPERYRLHAPLSPHAAAHLQGITLDIDFTLPETSENLVVEGAGGLMVPINDTTLVIDLIAHLHIPAILVSRHYLGSINHTLLSLEALLNRDIPVAGIVFVGQELPATEEAILKRYPEIPAVTVPWYSNLSDVEIAQIATILLPLGIATNSLLVDTRKGRLTRDGDN